MSTRPASAAIRPNATVVESGNGRILCVADIRGKISALNELAKESNAVAIIHTGDFGFFEESSLQRINDRTLRHLTMYSPLIPTVQRNQLSAPENAAPQQIREAVNISLLSEFPLLLSGELKLSVPVYTVYGACEDVFILEKFRSGQYRVDNLNCLDEATSRVLDVGGVKLRLLGLGGALVPHKMFDNGEGNATIAGGQGTMWTTALQIGELVDTAQKTFDPTETRLLVTHASPGREGIIAQLALVTKADLTISAGLHFRYATSYNEFSVQSDFQGFRTKLLAGKEEFDRVWETVRSQVEAVVDDNQRIFLDKVLGVVERIPPAVLPGHPDEAAWKNCWNWNLCDAAYGSLVLDVKDGRVSAEIKCQGFNYAYRRTATTNAATPHSATSALPNTSLPPTKGPTPVPPTKSSAPTPPPLKDTKPSTPAPPTKSSTPAPPAEKEKPKKKDNKKDKKDKNEAKDESTPETPTLSVPPSAVEAPSDDIKSPITDGAGSSGGARTPRGTKPQRNPWTIFMRLHGLTTLPSESEIREFFKEAGAGITKINTPPGGGMNNRPRIAYVEFGDEETMKAGLANHAEKLNDTVPEVMQATDKDSRDGPGGGRGTMRGRGRGSFAARNFAAAGLTKRTDSGNGDKA